MSAPIILTAALCIVTNIHDGDSIRCGREAIRLAAIDAPEMPGSPACRGYKAATHDCRYDEARKSRAALMRLLAGHRVTFIRLTTDRYQRTVARVYADGRDVSCAMVAGGFAVERYGVLGLCR